MIVSATDMRLNRVIAIVEIIYCTFNEAIDPKIKKEIDALLFEIREITKREKEAKSGR